MPDRMDAAELAAIYASLDNLLDAPVQRVPYKRVVPLAERLGLCRIGSKSDPGADASNPTSTAPLTAANDDPCPVALLGPTPTPSLSTIATPPTSVTAPSKRSRSRVLQAAVDDLNVYARSWRALWDHQITATCFDAVTNHPGAYAFTLKLHPRRDRFLSSRRGSDGMLTTRSDPADDLRRSISRELRSRFGVVYPFGFVFDVGSGGLHLHGVIVVPSEETLPDIRQVLARAGGRNRGKAAARQVNLVPLTDGVGWAGYSLKVFDDVCGWLGTHKITFVNDPLRRLGKAHHATQRALASPRKSAGTSPGFRGAGSA